MGRPKMLLPWGETTVLGHLIGQWRRLPTTQIIVVRAAGDERLREELRRLDFPLEQSVVNPSPQEGMFSSIQCAARWPHWKPELTHWAIVLGDQPHLRLGTLLALIQFALGDGAAICQPFYDHRPRHPVILPRPAFERLQETRESTLKIFLQNAPDGLKFCGIDDPGLTLDIDHPGDYQRAIQLFLNSP
jgi:molybdenum cofactor cytidylyltransferase